MTRTELCRRINDCMTAEGCSLSEDQDAVLAAALTAMWDEITGADQEPEAWKVVAKQGFTRCLLEREPDRTQFDMGETFVPLYTKEPK